MCVRLAFDLRSGEESCAAVSVCKLFAFSAQTNGLSSQSNHGNAPSQRVPSAGAYGLVNDFDNAAQSSVTAIVLRH